MGVCYTPRYLKEVRARVLGRLVGALAPFKVAKLATELALPKKTVTSKFFFATHNDRHSTQKISLRTWWCLHCLVDYKVIFMFLTYTASDDSKLYETPSIKTALSACPT